MKCLRYEQNNVGGGSCQIKHGPAAVSESSVSNDDQYPARVTSARADTSETVTMLWL